MHFCAVLGCLIMFEFTHCFITPTESEPECLGVQCQTFDPNTCKCEESAFPESPSNWPLGNYGLPASLYGCPEITWQTKYINMTVPSDIKDIYWEPGGFTFDHYSAPYKVPYNNKLLILGPFSERTVQLNFCVREDGDFNDLSIMHGKFCIYKIGTHCHDGYNEGSITIKGYRTDIRGFRTNVPTVDGGVLVSFCCRNDVISTLSNVLPQTYPFVLLKGPTAGSCEPLTNMIVTEDILYLTHDGVHFDYKGTLPNMTITDSHVGISFCVYQPEHYKDAVYSDYMYVAKTFPVYSVGKPYYSSPYVEPPANVTIGPEVVAGNGFTVVETYKPWLQIDLQQFVRIEYVFKIYKKIFFGMRSIMIKKLYCMLQSKCAYTN